MLLTVENRHLTLTVNTLGAEMTSLVSSDGTEYLWQADPAVWGQTAPILFPFIGRLTRDRYSYLGKEYPMGIHGFAARSEFSVAEQGEGSVTLLLSDTRETREQYPFSFSFFVTFTLSENTVNVTYRVENRGEETMPFGIGGHPGFRVPLLSGEEFEDYELVFDLPCRPDRVGFTPSVYLSGKDEAYPFEDGVRLPLRHDLFDEDAVILKNVARKVTLHSRRSGKGVTVSFPSMPYLGIWHVPKTCAEYVCIEPWSSLPSRQDVVEEFSCKSDLIQLPAHESYQTLWSITLN